MMNALVVKNGLRDWMSRLVRWATRSMVRILLVASAALLGLLIITLSVGATAAAETVESEKVVPAASAATGTIAYVRNGNEIRLIEPDGSNDRHLWTRPVETVHPLGDLDWNPAATELAFASEHEFGCSIFQSDIYAIRPDGGGLRRITNGPTCAELASFPKGTVTVTVENSNALAGPVFFVYVSGAPEVKQVSVSAGGATTVTFEDVADFGDVFQQAVAIDGLDRSNSPVAGADVIAGQTVHAGTVDAGAALPNFGAYVPVWHSDGTRLGFSFGLGSLAEIPANPAPGVNGTLLMNVQEGGAYLDWGPTPALANEILYFSYVTGQGIYRATAGSSSVGTRLVETELSEWVYNIEWLPDGSGFIYSHQTPFQNSPSNLYHYDFGSAQSVPLTQYTNLVVRDFSLSPDGQSIVFELATAWDAPEADLWMLERSGREGTQAHLFVENGQLPSWSSRDPQLPPQQKFSYIPVNLR
jgi:Tol biopolymer transport system component